MAEQALYGNNDEAPFPFEQICGRLSWLPVYLNDHTSYPSYDLAPLLNTVLVFGRARTSTLQDRRQWNEVHSLTKRLNSALESIGALHHTIELVLRGRHNFFVTCSHSPRFNWKLAPSALNFRLIGLVHLVEIRPNHVGIRPTLGLVSSDPTKGFLVFVGSRSR